MNRSTLDIQSAQEKRRILAARPWSARASAQTSHQHLPGFEQFPSAELSGGGEGEKTAPLTADCDLQSVRVEPALWMAANPKLAMGVLLFSDYDEFARRLADFRDKLPSDLMAISLDEMVREPAKCREEKQ